MTMNTLYQLVTGPLAWAAFVVFVGGLLGRFIWLAWLAGTRDLYVRHYMSLKFGLRSMLAWIVPFYARNWRLRPVFTVVTFAFHICLLASPLLLAAHNILWDEAFGVSLPSVADGVADAMSWVVVASCVYFFVRRLTVNEVRYVTSPLDLALIALVALPYLTGALAYRQILGYETMIVLHILSAEALLALIPFTWLSHIILGPMVRAYMGSEFGGQRHVQDW